MIRETEITTFRRRTLHTTTHKQIQHTCTCSVIFPYMRSIRWDPKFHETFLSLSISLAQHDVIALMKDSGMC